MYAIRSTYIWAEPGRIAPFGLSAPAIAGFGCAGFVWVGCPLATVSAIGGIDRAIR